MRRAIVNFIVLILAFVFQTSFFSTVPYMSVAPNLLLILTFSIAFVYGELEGVIYGMICGILMDLFYTTPFGFYTLIFSVIGYFNGAFSRFYYDNYIFLPMLLSAVNELVYNIYIFIYMFLIKGKKDFPFYFGKIILPEIVLTVVCTLLFYRLILAYNSALKTLDDRKNKNKKQLNNA